MKVSVIIPCLNVEALLSKTLESVWAQEHRDLEVIAVDDGSTDGTAALLDAAAAQHPGIMQVVHRANRGASAARNEGLRHATGEWVQFLDADDILAPDKISGQLRLVAGHDQAGIVVGDYEKVMPDGLLLPVEALYDRPWMALIKTRMGTTSANLLRREPVLAAGGWNEDQSSSQDYELLFRLLQQAATVLWDRRVSTWVLKRASGSISLTQPQQNWERYIALRKRMRDHLVALDPQAYRAEIEALDQYIFMALRILAEYDRAAAVRHWRDIIPGGFVPEESRAISRRYIGFYKLLGFGNAERLVRLLRGQPSLNDPMIRSYQDFLDHREADRIALRRKFDLHLLYDEVWKFQRLLRRVEYLLNCKKHKGIVWRLIYKWYSLRFHYQSVRCGYDIPPNTFGPGLSIAHRGTIVVHPDARVGRNCRIHVDVVIGTRPGPLDLVPIIGDNCYVGPGVKIFGDIMIGDNVAIGANSVVNHSFPEGNMTIAGAPARKISDTGSQEFIIATRSKTFG